MKNKLTFIIVTWNNNNTIIECLDSIYKNCKEFEVVIVDNNSTDETINLIKEKRYKNCNLIVLEENVGFAKGNNIGLEQVKTEYICYLNPDTILLEDIIIPSIKVLDDNKNIGLVGCKLLNLDKTLQSSTFNFINAKQVFFEAFKIGKFMPNFIKEKYFPNDSKAKKDKFVDWVIGAEMILKTDDAKLIGGFSTEYYMYVEDMDLCKKIEKALNKKTYYLSNTELIHIGGVSESKNINYNKLEKLIKNKIIFANKFYGEREAKKVKKALYNVYAIRLFFIKYLYWFRNRKYYLEKMQTGYNICKNIFIEEKGE